MTKSIASYPEHQRAAVIARRLKNKTDGSGYHSAVAAAKELGIPVPSSSNFKSRADRAERDRKRDQKQPLKRRQFTRESGTRLRDARKSAR